MISYILENFPPAFRNAEMIKLLKERGARHFVFKNEDDARYYNHIDGRSTPTDYLNFETSIRNGKVVYFGSLAGLELTPDYSDEDNDFIGTQHGVNVSRKDIDSGIFNCNQYYPYVSRFLLNRDRSFVLVSDFKEDYWRHFEKHGVDAAIFVRPNSGLKPITGQLIDLKDINAAIEHINTHVNKSEFLVVSPPKKIIGEWRFVVFKDQIITYSTYLYNGLMTEVPSAPQGAIDKCQEILNDNLDFLPPSGFSVLDIGQVGKEYFLIEQNCLFTSGLYACNKSLILDAIERYIK